MLLRGSCRFARGKIGIVSKFQLLLILIKCIFNDLVETGIIPEDWKSANVTAFTRNEACKNLETTDPLVLLL